MLALCMYSVPIFSVERTGKERKVDRVDVWEIQCTSFLPL